LLLRKVDPVVHFREEEIHDQGEWQNEQQTDKGEFPRILQAVHDRNGGGEQNTPGLLLRPLLAGKRAHGLTSRSSGLLLFFPDAIPLVPEKSIGSRNIFLTSLTFPARRAVRSTSRASSTTCVIRAANLCWPITTLSVRRRP